MREREREKQRERERERERDRERKRYIYIYIPEGNLNRCRFVKGSKIITIDEVYSSRCA